MSLASAKTEKEERFLASLGMTVSDKKGCGYFNSTSMICPGVIPTLPRLWVTLASTKRKSPGPTPWVADWPSGEDMARLISVIEMITYGRACACIGEVLPVSGIQL